MDHTQSLVTRALTNALWPEDFGSLLRQCRLADGLTQEELAKRAGLSVRGIQALERGGTRPHRSTIERLVRAMALAEERCTHFEALARRPRVSHSVSRRHLPHTLGPNKMPAELTPLIGRDRDVEEIRRLLLREDVRMLTLTGPPGGGKSRLALRVATDLLGCFRHGVHFADLSQAGDPHLLVSAIARVFGPGDPGPSAVPDHPKHCRCGAHLLLVLDNFEHVLTSAPTIAELSAAAPYLKVLLTSRSALGVRAEHEFPVVPLDAPEPGRTLPLEDLVAYPAVRLFVERATAARPDFALSSANASSVAEICCRLDGLPLAIELAASHIRTFCPEAMLVRLTAPLQFLTPTIQDLPQRQRSMEEAIAYSYRLLDEGEKMLFRRLAVFDGSFTLEAAERVCAGAGGLGVDPLRGVEALVAKSLLRAQKPSDGEIRLDMLRLVHEYARERMLESEDRVLLERAHAAYYWRCSPA